MLRNWKLFGVTTMIVFALTTPAPAGDKDGPPPDDKIKALETKIDKLIESIAGSFRDAKLDANAIRDELKAFKMDTKLKMDLATRGLELLDERLGRLRQDVDSLKNGGTKAYYPPDGKDVVAELRAEIAQLRLIIAKSSPGSQPIVTTGTTGQLMVVNRYPEEILLMVNGAEQGRIPANSSRVIQGLPLGAVTYEIISPTWGSSGIRRSNILAGDPLRVNVQ